MRTHYGLMIFTCFTVDEKDPTTAGETHCHAVTYHSLTPPLNRSTTFTCVGGEKIKKYRRVATPFAQTNFNVHHRIWKGGRRVATPYHSNIPQYRKPAMATSSVRTSLKTNPLERCGPQSNLLSKCTMRIYSMIPKRSERYNTKIVNIFSGHRSFWI